MGAEWKPISLNKALNINPVVRLERGKEYPFVDMKSVIPSARKVESSENRVFKGNGSRFKEDDTLLARITPCLENGKIARYHSVTEIKEAHGSTEFIVIRGRENVTDNVFVYYLVRSDDIRKYLISQMTGSSGRQRVPVNAFKNLTTYIPPLSEQQKIAEILSTFDDKIELNHRMCKTLEDMAQAIFKSWFVDFDPVYAKAAGKQPEGMKPEIAALFPDSFINTEKGQIPKGWSASRLGDHFNLTMGQSPPGSTYNEDGDGETFYQGRTDFGFKFPKNRVYCTAPTRFANKGDTLVSVRAPVGDVNMADKRCAIGRGVAAVRHISGSSIFTYYSMKQLRNNFVNFEAEGTVFGSITKRDFLNLPFNVPPMDIVKNFDRLFSVIEKSIEEHEIQSLIISSLRDYLLPKLISGEIRTGMSKEHLGSLEDVNEQSLI